MTSFEPDFLNSLPDVPNVEASPDFSRGVMQRVQKHRRVKQRNRSIRSGAMLAVMVGLLVYTNQHRFTPPEYSHRVASATAGVDWLIETQQADGGWDAEAFGGHRSFNQGVSALATLALLYSPDPVAESTLTKAGDFLTAQAMQKPVHLFTGPELYNHVLTLNTLLEINSRAPNRERTDLLRQSISHLVRLQQPDGGWGYAEDRPMGYGNVENPESNSAITWWVCHLLEKSQSLNLGGTREAHDQGEKWLAQRFQSSEQIAYQANGNGTATPEDALYWMAARTVASLEQNATSSSTLSSDAYRDVFRTPGIHGEDSLDHIYAGQNENGAWNRPQDRWWKAGGQIYVTAACVLSLVPQGGV
jgi:hypothetical protein